MKSAIPKVTVQRLPVYLRCLESLPAGQSRVSSDELAALAGVNAAKVRKDLSYLGSYGVRGVGYDVDKLRLQIGLELGLEEDWAVVIVGIGNLGRALANFAGFEERRFRIVGLFDVDPRKVGRSLDGVPIDPMDRLPEVVEEHGARIGIVTTPAHAAQQVAEQLAAAGVESILNFAPTVIRAPKGTDIRRVDLSTELQVLSFYLHRKG
ncbi:MAG TPA: redox-sensing transcriptional repressor Rex [Acidimicrobiia bacterium]|nr:redox-sensing transcriptional repressor Rex [Acidimicrobiia bacterium]